MSQTNSILIVDDDQIVADSLAAFFHAEGFVARSCYSPEEALNELNQHAYQILLTDLNLPSMTGIDLLRKAKTASPTTAIILITGYGSIETAVEALRIGAIDFLTKPIVDEELRLAVTRAQRHHEVLKENNTLRARNSGSPSTPEQLTSILGADPRMRSIFQTINAVAPARTTVLMTGESGVGKSLIAGAIHKASPRASAPYVELACGSIPETLLESELFGHTKGAFTGAHADKAGKFLAADGGTLFLDEINSASPAMQLKLLRVLQERKFEPVGSNETIEVDVRVVLATNQPLEALVESGQFRQDLYYRINVVKIEVPPLRDRIIDLPVLAHHFLDEQSKELGRRFVGFNEESMRLLAQYQYPGNVRELSNIIERAAVLAQGQTITADDLPPHMREINTPHTPTLLAQTDDDSWTPMTLVDALREPERQIILGALAANDWNRSQTADILGINRTTLYKKMKALGIDPDDHAQAS
ncbi:MAG: sigma-54-dependent transcriptional regulator [Phycisphaerales bacterium]